MTRWKIRRERWGWSLYLDDELVASANDINALLSFYGWLLDLDTHPTRC